MISSLGSISGTVSSLNQTISQNEFNPVLSGPVPTGAASATATGVFYRAAASEGLKITFGEILGGTVTSAALLPGLMLVLTYEIAFNSDAQLAAKYETIQLTPTALDLYNYARSKPALPGLAKIVGEWPIVADIPYIGPVLDTKKPHMLYTLRAARDGLYPVYDWGLGKTSEVQLKKGDVVKIGTTINPESRYTKKDLLVKYGGLEFVPELYGTESIILAAEKIRLLTYIATHGHLPPGNTKLQ